jgi:hypothetical protein
LKTELLLKKLESIKMFKFSDNSTVNVMSACRLATIPIWKGNRNIDESHVARISESIRSIQELNITPFRLVNIIEDGVICTYLIDGQHRSTIIKEHFKDPYAEDFNVLVIEKDCSDEVEIIEYFEKVNRMKPMFYREDPQLVANRYITPFLKEFNKDPKKPLVRQGKVNRPYLSVDRLREILIEKHVVDWRTTPLEFVARCREINDNLLTTLDKTVSVNKRAIELKFALGVNDFKFI